MLKITFIIRSETAVPYVYDRSLVAKRDVVRARLIMIWFGRIDCATELFGFSFTVIQLDVATWTTTHRDAQKKKT